ncbi:MAG: glycerol-3-phosphate 1-O-acyltransferase PlsY [Victivallaceae bacterium]|nr:glycerol-3-phosphate 1-O-acyltransferase PlsY [Victivallaceae bacterium]
MPTATILILSAVVLISYLIGAIPWGYLIGRRHGVDIRTRGSRNIGATNVTRVIGKWSGRLCFGLDFLKGFLPVLVVTILCKQRIITDHYHVTQMLAALSATLGHMFPVYLGFRGGKGVATASGAVLALAPYSFVIAGIVWVAVYLLSRYVSLASIAAAAIFPICATLITLLKPGLYYHSWYVVGFLYLIAALTILRHAGNIKRLLKGTENKFGKTDLEA